MAEVHEDICGSHQSGPKMKIKIKRLGYCLPTMTLDCIEYAKRCHQCQVFSPVLQQPSSVLHSKVASWPFEAWGTNIMGPIDPPSSRGHQFILATTDYFSKWAEAILLREVKADNVLYFFKNNIIYRFGVSCHIISDNGLAFKNTKINIFARRHHIDWRYSTIYYSRENGLAEAFDKNLVGLIRKILHANKKTWHEKLLEALWAYCMTYHSPTSSTPCALTLGSEAVLPLEVELPSLCVAISNNVNNKENTRLRLEELDSLEGLRL
ncbi:uncharacterized protein K02A2.6-like [Phalaenopsis equestris]|uniref:uncharacterized protein K02A2.6-like n=1 Tax=Phalaenopsis equestris TaxID=78828 RepID=UPI0009E4B101|nr:uncharacterized protein K02A2.6-like [Phalaenopsis equestris]